MMFKWLLIVYCVLLLAFPFIENVESSSIPANKLHSLKLDHAKVKMSWVIDWYNKEVLFHVKNTFQNKYKWFALGFSKRGEYERSDLCIFQIKNGIYEMVIDAYTNGDASKISVDESQDCVLMRMDDNSIAFKRKFDTCDPQDLKMNEGTMYILWLRGVDDIEFVDGTTDMPNVGPKNKGSITVQILRADKIDIPEKSIKSSEISVKNVKVPTDETTYWCKIKKLEPSLMAKKHHIVQFEPVITSEMFVHHVEVFHCETDAEVDIPLYEGNCNDMPEEGKVCAKVMALWAMGAGVFTYPPETGLPLGGKNYNPYIRLEVHYNNPDRVDGIIDNSGMKINIVSKLRKYDAGIVELGLEYTDKMAIPYGQLAFPLSGYCIAECTKVSLPPDGVVVFGSQLHTHLRGVRIMTRHFRGDRELRELNRDDYYSHHYQEIRQLRHKPVVMPGDALVTTCYYDTRGYTNTTLGGFSISDEMCVNYIHYYPAANLELCKSAVSEKTLQDYFEYMKNKEHQEKVEIDGARSENYRSIEWTQPRVDELFTMYTQEPLSMQCNRSDGFRFEGFDWEGAPITPVKIWIPYNDDEKCKKPNLRWFKPLQEGECDWFGDCIY